MQPFECYIQCIQNFPGQHAPYFPSKQGPLALIANISYCGNKFPKITRVDMDTHYVTGTL